VTAILHEPRLVRLATWLGQRWCGLTTGHAYIRQPDPWRIALVCWTCNHESTGWWLLNTDATMEVKPVSRPRRRRPSSPKGGSRW